MLLIPLPALHSSLIVVVISFRFEGIPCLWFMHAPTDDKVASKYLVMYHKPTLQPDQLTIASIPQNTEWEDMYDGCNN